MNTIIKITAALPAFALISACSTTAPVMPTSPTTTPTKSVPNLAYDRMAPVPYTCSDDSEVLAKQSINKEQANIIVTAPKLNWSRYRLVLNGDVQGKVASYVNNSSPEVIYAWHMQGDTGVLAMKWSDGKTYQIDCKI